VNKKIAFIASFLLFLIPQQFSAQSAPKSKGGSTCYISGSVELFQMNEYVCSGKNNKFYWSLTKSKAKKIPTNVAKSQKPIEGDTCSISKGSIIDLTVTDGYTKDFKYTKFLVCSTPSNDARFSSGQIGTWQRNSMLLNENYIVEGDKCVFPQPETMGYSSGFNHGILNCSRLNKYEYVKDINQVVGSLATLRSYDPLVGSEWQKEQSTNYKFYDGNPQGPFRYLQSNLNYATPKTQSVGISDLLLATQCKLTQSQPWQFSDWVNTGFPYPSERWRPSSVKVQIIPVEFLDLKANSTPMDEYGKYFSGVENYFKNTSDNSVNFKWQVPNKFLTINQKSTDFIKNFGFDFGPEVIKMFDSQIDFTNVDVVVIVTTSRTNNDQSHPSHMHLPLKNPIATAEKLIYNYSVQEDLALGVKDPVLGWVHHFLHMAGFADNFRYPESKLGLRRYSPEWSAEIGPSLKEEKVQIENNKYMGVWGNMSIILLSEPLIWEKWLIGQINDDQIACVDSSKGGTFWLRPNAIKSEKLKGIVIPISNKKAIVLESIRSAGYNWRIYPRNQGLLAYTVDTSNNDVEGHPFEIIRKGGLFDKDYLLDAPLRSGESVSINGLKITVVESGDFGDVVKVEKVA